MVKQEEIHINIQHICVFIYVHTETNTDAQKQVVEKCHQQNLPKK